MKTTPFSPWNPPELTHKHKIIVMACLMALAFLAFHPALNNHYIWDDDAYVTKNDNLRTKQGLVDIWLTPRSIPQYYPITHTTFWIEYQLWGIKSFGYHFNNILLHGFSAFLLWLILARLGVQGAFLVAAVFAVHPVHTESVAWVTERKNTLSGLFYLSALYCYLRYSPSIAFNGGVVHDQNTTPPTAGGMRRFYVAALGLFILALLSKTITATLPAVVLVILWWQNGNLKKRDVLASLPFFGLGMGFGITTALLERYHVGAQGKDFAFNLIERCLIAGRALWFYAGKLVWPKDLMFIYPRWQIDATQWWQYMFPVSFAGILVALYLLKDRIGRGALAAVLIFSGTLFPALGFLNVYPHRFSFVADHFQYLASIAIFTLLVGAFSHASIRWTASQKKKELVFLGVAALMLLNLTLKSARQTFSYRDPVVLWQDTAAKNPGSWMVYTNLAAELQYRQDHDGAIAAAQKALDLKPNCEPALYTLGQAYYYLRQFDEAMDAFQRLTKIFHAGTGSEPSGGLRVAPGAYLSMATIEMSYKRYDIAENYIHAALDIKPGSHRAYRNLGTLRALQRRYAEAIELYLKALPVMKGDPVLAHDLGLAYYATGKYKEAITYLNKALEIRPNYPDAQKYLNKLRKHSPDLNASPSP